MSTEILDAINRNFGRNIYKVFFYFEDLSFCFWINLKNLRTSKILDHQPKNKQGFGFTLQKDYGFLNLKNVDLLFDYNFFHVPNRWEFLQFNKCYFKLGLIFIRWRHFCVVYDSAKEDFKIFADGRLTFEKDNLQVVAGHRFQDNLLSSITLGKNPLSWFRSFCVLYC